MILCKLRQRVSSTRDLTFPVSRYRTTEFTSLWACAIRELSSFIEQNVPEIILKVSSRKSPVARITDISQGKDNLGET